MDPFVEADQAVHGHRDSPLNPQHVSDVFRACMEGVEVNADGSLPDTAVKVVGIAHTVVFSRAVLDARRRDIAGMLAQLPDDFRPHDKGGGGGWSTLNAVVDRDGNTWTDLHLTMEQLLLLGIATGQAGWCLPREMWSALPGGMPYVMVDPDLP